MNRERIQRAIRTLRRVPESKFDMDLWAEFQHRHAIGERPRLSQRCGTVGCALGWIASTTAARREGLALEVDVGCVSATPRFKNSRGVTAAANYFEMNHSVATYLFGGNYCWLDADCFTRPGNVADALELYLELGDRRFREFATGAGQPSMWLR